MVFTANNLDVYLTGKQIIELHHSGKRFVVGRSGGMNGDSFISDLQTGGWKTFSYQVKFSLTPPNRNWFSSENFLKKVEHEEMIKAYDKNNTPAITDPWDFSHLGKDYFLTVSVKLGYGHSLDAPIETIYIGKTGVPYSEKKNRSVNPNWAVIMEDGREFRCGSSIGFAVEEGLWDISNCNTFSWSEIKQHFSKLL